MPKAKTAMVVIGATTAIAVSGFSLGVMLGNIKISDFTNLFDSNARLESSVTEELAVAESYIDGKRAEYQQKTFRAEGLGQITSAQASIMLQDWNKKHIDYLLNIPERRCLEAGKTRIYCTMFSMEHASKLSARAVEKLNRQQAARAAQKSN